MARARQGHRETRGGPEFEPKRAAPGGGLVTDTGATAATISVAATAWHAAAGDAGVGERPVRLASSPLIVARVESKIGPDRMLSMLTEESSAASAEW